MPFSLLCSTFLLCLFLRLPVNTLCNCLVCQVPKSPLPTSWVWWYAWRSHRTQHKTVLMGMIYYSKSIQSKRAKEKVYGAKSGGNQAQSSRVRAIGVPQEVLNSPSNWVVTCVKCCLPQKLIKDAVPGLLLQESHRYLLPSTYQNYQNTLYKRLSHSKQLVSVRVEGTLEI